MSDFLDYPITRKQIRQAGPGSLRVGHYNADYGQYLIKKTDEIAAGSSGSISIPIKTQGTTFLAAIGHTWRPNSLFTLSAGSMRWPQTNGQWASVSDPFYFQPVLRVRDAITLSITNNSDTAREYELLAYLIAAGVDYQDEMENAGALMPEDYYPFTGETASYSTGTFTMSPPTSKTFTLKSISDANYLVVKQVTVEQIAGVSLDTVTVTVELAGQTLFTQDFTGGGYLIKTTVQDPEKFGIPGGDLTATVTYSGGGGALSKNFKFTWIGWESSA